MPDSLGTKDIMAVVISKDTLDWFGINKQISHNPGRDFALRLNEIFRNKLVQNTRFQTTAKGNMQFKAEGDNNAVVACIFEIDKQ